MLLPSIHYQVTPRSSSRRRSLRVPYRQMHDDVIKWTHFPRYWPFVRGIHRSSVNYPHKGQWHGALMFSLICAWINRWVNNHEAGDLRRHPAQYDVILMYCSDSTIHLSRWSGTSGVVPVISGKATCPIPTLSWLTFIYIKGTNTIDNPTITSITSLFYWNILKLLPQDNEVHGANMWPTCVLSAPGGPHVGPMNLAIRVMSLYWLHLYVRATGETRAGICAILKQSLHARYTRVICRSV